uniref:Uncharacterized protein n=1 Tax=Rhizophora mucronata TaxID=61149 RepID=A0A2P2NFJ5_RHIMU
MGITKRSKLSNKSIENPEKHQQ